MVRSAKSSAGPPARSNEAVNSATAVRLAQNQLASRQAYAEHLDTLALGLLGFAGALIAVDIAAQAYLGWRWWWPIVGLALCSLLCILTIPARARLDFGPDPASFYKTYGDLDEAEANVLLLEDLRDVLGKDRVRHKEWLFIGAFVILLATMLAAVVAFAIL